MPSLTKEQVFKIAKLAKLEITEEEALRFTSILGETLEYVKVLEELDTTNTPETFQVTGLQNVFQSKEKRFQTDIKSFSQEEALSNGKNTRNGLFVTKAVFDRK